MGAFDPSLPLTEAWRVLDSLDRSTWCELISIARAPALLDRTFTVMALIFNLSPDRQSGNCTDSSINVRVSYFHNMRRFILNNDSISDFYDKLRRFDTSSLSTEALMAMKEYYEDSSISAENIGRMSLAGAAFCQWIRAVYILHHAKQSSQHILTLSET